MIEYRSTIELHNHEFTPQGLGIDVPIELIPQFKQLISKALNSFPDAHPALKELGDMLTHGKVLQDYYSQRTDKQLIAPSDC